MYISLKFNVIFLLGFYSVNDEKPMMVITRRKTYYECFNSTTLAVMQRMDNIIVLKTGGYYRRMEVRWTI